MKITYTGSYNDLKEKLKDLEGEWIEHQPNKKVFRQQNSLMNWYESTGTINFQGKPLPTKKLEDNVKHILYPEEFTKIEEPAIVSENNNDHSSMVDSITTEENVSTQYLNNKFTNSELIIGLVSAVGTESTRVTTPLKSRLEGFGYNVIELKVSSLLTLPNGSPHEYHRIKHYIELGDNIRKSSGNHGILAYGVAKLIKESRPSTPAKTAYIINSLKHPDEVSILRKIYGQGFYLFGIHSDKKRRFNHLTGNKHLSQSQANELIAIDEDENVKHGQKTRDTYHLSDFYLNVGKNEDQVINTIQRFLELIFSHPYKNPTFDEFAMYMAFSSSVRSGDLSRQVGAVISKNKQIIATGANEVPSAGGGHYWAETNSDTGEVFDLPDGKDYMRSHDSNKAQQIEIIEKLKASISEIEDIDTTILEKITSKLNNSPIKDLTEYGRVVHAEMQAILSCAKEGINCSNGTLYCTTFPCHNCAKHLIASGIKRVVYVEPYPKSKALEFHSESIKIDEIENQGDQSLNQNLVLFEPFIGVGARRFLDFFSMSSGSGSKLKRKDSEGNVVDWTKQTANIRVHLLPESYIEIERNASEVFDNVNNDNK